ncbi:hypothetical protein AVEN_91740-1 [Araneus ventricosus]|uniref:Uncharacterized protein n=1 Tax=Araneus ventricosus TaxID=182803 RepID=A0A4Y2SQJ9_ARAVE|nr:hypothetical protein AVEN_91740-1 [Araneus ventricosus]
MRSCRTSKQVLASPLVVWLFGSTPMTGGTPVKRRFVAGAARNEGYYAETTMPDYLSRRLFIYVTQDAKAGWGDSLRLPAGQFNNMAPLTI